MAISVYTTDEDLVAIRPDILSLGGQNFVDWSAKHEEAFKLINRVLIGRWYKEAAADRGFDYRTTPFDPDKLQAADVTTLSAYKTLELIYIYLMTNTPKESGFERQATLFRNLYNEELRNVLAIGVSYDWDDSDTFTDAEVYDRVPRRLTRV